MPGEFFISAGRMQRRLVSVQYIIQAVLGRGRYQWTPENPPVDLRLLRYFVTVAEEMHLPRGGAPRDDTAAASQAIRALEDALGVALFVRTKRSVELTPVGKDLLPEVGACWPAAEALRPLAQVARARARRACCRSRSFPPRRLRAAAVAPARFRRALSRACALQHRPEATRATCRSRNSSPGASTRGS